MARDYLSSGLSASKYGLIDSETLSVKTDHLGLITIIQYGTNKP